MKYYEASFYQNESGKKVRCNLCAHHCLIQDGCLGFCRVRQNQGGKLVSLNYGRLIASHTDPIEKKPLYHFLPGSKAYSIATPGCNLRCEWCQNWEISQADCGPTLGIIPDTTPESVVNAALRSRSASIAYTYTEPTIFYEFARDTALLAKEQGLKNLFVTNGMMTTAVIEELALWLDAANVDIKAFTEEAYWKYTGGRLSAVLECCQQLKQRGVWLEVTTLIVPGINDDEAQLTSLTEYIAGKLGQETPWHLSRYFPQYRSRAAATSLQSLENAEQIGRKAGLKFIYPGNVHAETVTKCPQCGTDIIHRLDYRLQTNRIKKGRCPQCWAEIPGVWEE